MTVKAHAIRFLVRLVALLPLRGVQCLGALIGRMAWALNTTAAKVTRTNLTLCYPQLSKAEVSELGKASLIETAKTITEMCKIWTLNPEHALAYIKAVREDFDVEAAVTSGKGVIAVVPHLGNWELLNLYAGNRFNLNILYQPPKIIELDPFIRRVRERLGTQVYATDRRGVAAMFQALRDGQVVGILPDQQPPAEAGRFAAFFGIDTLTMTLLSKLAQKTDAVVVCAYAKRLPKGQGFEVVLKPADPEVYSQDLDTSIAALNRSVEACVNEAAAQYQWEYKRFRHAPEGRTQHYRYR